MKADIFFRSEELPVQVRKFKDIHINAGNRTDAEPQELLKNGPAQTAKPYDDNMRLARVSLDPSGKGNGRFSNSVPVWRRVRRECPCSCVQRLSLPFLCEMGTKRRAFRPHIHEYALAGIIIKN